MNAVEEAIRRYFGYFHETFPLYFFMNATNEQIIKKIDECIKKNEPFHVEHDDRVIM